jgi:hypothetical protein
MAQQNLNRPPTPRMGPNLSDSPEFGDSWDAALAKLQAMLTEVYGAKNVFAKYTANAGAGPLTASAGDMTGAQSVTCNYSNVGANNLTTRTAAQLFADQGAIAGQTIELELMNSSGGTMTLVGGTGVTVNGTATLATNTTRWFAVTFVSAAAVTIQNLGSGAI